MSLLKSLEQLTSKICEPCSKSFPDPYIRKVLYNRNKAVLPFAITSLPIYISLIFAFQSMCTLFHITSCCLFAIIVFVWNTFCRTNIEVFNWFCAIAITFYFPIIAKILSQNLVFFNFVGVLCIPGVLLHWTGNGKIFLLSCMSQLILLNTTYKSQIEEYLAASDPKVADTLMFAGNYGAIINMILINISFKALNKAYGEISNAKQMEFDQQKSFILSLSHELRNPLNGLLGNIQLASVETSVQEIRRVLKNANICGQVLLHLVNNVLDSGKVEIGRLEVNANQNDTKYMIEDIWSICSDLIKKKQLYGSLQVSKNMPQSIKIDAYRLMQIMLNLIGNAIKFTDKGKITVQFDWIGSSFGLRRNKSEPQPFDEDGIFEKNERVSLITRRRWETKDYYLLDTNRPVFDTEVGELFKSKYSHGTLKISVIDTGCGMSQDCIKKLFKMFGQVHEDDAKRKIGTGLGLFISKELCKRMNGDITVFSKPKEGSAFIITLPI